MSTKSLSQTVVKLETLTATRAIEFSIELGFSKVIFEGDLETVIKALQDQGRSHSLALGGSGPP